MQLVSPSKALFPCILFASLLTHHLVTPSGSEGSSCTQDEDCDDPSNRTTFLECDLSLCKCSNGTSSYFDLEDGRCHAHLDTECALMPCPTNGYCYNLPSSAPNRKECKCSMGFFPTTEGKCSKKYGGTCKIPSDCDQDSYMQCLNLPFQRICGCNDTYAIYNPSENKCELKVGQVCNEKSEQSCAVGSVCNEEEEEEMSSKCQCKAHLVVTDENVCRVPLGKPCIVNEEPCDEKKFIYCANNVCKCNEGLVDDGKGCHGSFGQRCGINDTPSCDETKFLECDPQGTMRTCKCRSDLVDLGMGECRAIFNQSCSSGEKCDESKFLDCSATSRRCVCRPDLVDLDGSGNCRSVFGGSCTVEAKGPPCDETKFLECDNKTCRCRVDLVDIDLGQCRSKFGSACGGQGMARCDETKYLKCSTVDGKCGCREGSSDIGDGICRIDFGQPCFGSMVCDETKFLNCSASGKCECGEGLKDIGEGECRAGIGGSCGDKDEGALCDESGGLECGSGKTCQCRNGLKKNSKGECRVHFGGSCLGAGAGCNEEEFLICNEEKECGCQEGMIRVHEGKGECRGLFGSLCDGGEVCNEGDALVCGVNGRCVCKAGFLNQTREGQCSGSESGFQFYSFVLVLIGIVHNFV